MNMIRYKSSEFFISWPNLFTSLSSLIYKNAYIVLGQLNFFDLIGFVGLTFQFLKKLVPTIGLHMPEALQNHLKNF